MRFSVDAPDPMQAVAELELEAAKDITGAMRLAGEGLKTELRETTKAVGLGAKVGNAWRNRTYPTTGVSLGPAAVVSSNAAKIIDAFASGVVILPRAGRFLAIPSDNVPRGARGVRIGPAELQRRLGKPLVLKPRRGGGYFALGDVTPKRGRAGFSLPKGRRAYGPQAPQKGGQLVLFYTYVPAVRLARRLDVEAAAQRWADRIPDLVIDNALGAPEQVAVRVTAGAGGRRGS